MLTHKLNQDYEKWKSSLNKYIYRIIRRKIEDMNVDLEHLYFKNFHPYIAAIMVILDTKEYKERKFYDDFVIPYHNRIVIAYKTC
jgi:hypothetical protein